MQKSRFEGDWSEEATRLAREECTFCFDHLAAGVADLLEGSRSLSALYSDKYPMVIVDEFQDTDDDQWRVVKALAERSEVVCLADPDQRIFDYRPNVDPQRIAQLRDELTPSEFDLGSENHRSPSAGILTFADSVLHNRRPLPTADEVTSAHYYGKDLEAVVHAHVAWMFSALRQADVEEPSVAVLCRSNPFLLRLSTALMTARSYAGRTLSPISHDVAWDADLSATT